MCFFFFKQKTAYEMRISDWSSDVCSSDLLTGFTIAGALDGLAKGDFTSRELTEAHLVAMERARGLNAFIVETPEKARAMADASDIRRKQGKDRKSVV